jgi:threonine/homoserine/homoserine lactone efflux protein
MTRELLPFAGVAALIIVVPGVDMALVTKNALRGRRAALATAIGVNAGVAVWIVASALGVAAVVRESAIAFSALKLAGAVYLLFLGLQLLRGARGLDPEPEPSRGEADAAECFRQGVLNNLLNPKMPIVFLSLLPQFVTPHSSALAGSLVLGGLFLAMGVAWLSVLALVAARAAGALRRPRVRAWIETVTGFVLVGLAVRLATERR